jgi:signal transduction histidine kinase
MNITLVFFIYGLAFFSMGLAMFFESGRSPVFTERRVLIPLAVFGVVHGAHEWLEMFLDRSEWLVVLHPALWGWLRIYILIISFGSLIVFGMQVIFPDRAFTGREKNYWIFGLVLYILTVAVAGIVTWLMHGNLISHLDAAARYFLAVPGAAIAGIALNRDANRAYRQSLPDLGLALRAASLGFLIYAFTQLVVPPLEMFPANFLNTTSFRAMTGIPIQVIRATVAILATIGLIQATRVLEGERQREFLSVQEARIEALQQLEQELTEREKMREEHLQHIVQAQEDERAKIARELHDETSQTLTAFTLHLAALRNVLGDNPDAIQQLDHLRALSRQMSVGIYRLVHDLRPSQLDDLGLVAALQYFVDETEKQTGLKVKFEIAGERCRLESIVETALYRIAQEALTNAARHAEVKEAVLKLTFNSEEVSMAIIDQGVGFLVDQKTAGGWGLAGMRERAESIGGNLNIYSSPSGGTKVEIIIAKKVDDQPLVPI